MVPTIQSLYDWAYRRYKSSAGPMSSRKRTAIEITMKLAFQKFAPKTKSTLRPSLEKEEWSVRVLGAL